MSLTGRDITGGPLEGAERFACVVREWLDVRLGREL